MMREKSLLIYWTDKATMQRSFPENGELLWIFSSLLFLAYEVAVGADERGTRFRTV
jgi:hypothetical protein